MFNLTAVLRKSTEEAARPEPLARHEKETAAARPEPPRRPDHATFRREHLQALRQAGFTSTDLKRLADHPAWRWAEAVFWEPPDEVHFWRSEPWRLSVFFPGAVYPPGEKREAVNAADADGLKETHGQPKDKIWPGQSQGERRT